MCSYRRWQPNVDPAFLPADPDHDPDFILDRSCFSLNRYQHPTRTLPPRPHLEHSQVIDYRNFSELKTLDHDLLSRPWATLTNQQAANEYFKVDSEHAKEEIHLCNVKVARMWAWADAEDAEISNAVAAAQQGQDSAFTAHLKVVQVQRKYFNDCFRLRLSQISNLSGYSGPPLTVTTLLIPPTPDDDRKCRCVFPHSQRTYFPPYYSHNDERGSR